MYIFRNVHKTGNTYIQGLESFKHSSKPNPLSFFKLKHEILGMGCSYTSLKLLLSCPAESRCAGSRCVCPTDCGELCEYAATPKSSVGADSCATHPTSFLVRLLLVHMLVNSERFLWYDGVFASSGVTQK